MVAEKCCNGRFQYAKRIWESHLAVLDAVHELGDCTEAASVSSANRADYFHLAESYFRRSLSGREQSCLRCTSPARLNDLALVARARRFEENTGGDVFAPERSGEINQARCRECTIYMFNCIDLLVDAGHLEEAEAMSRQASRVSREWSMPHRHMPDDRRAMMGGGFVSSFVEFPSPGERGEAENIFRE